MKTANQIWPALLLGLLAFAIQLIWLVREFSVAIAPMFPPGNNLKADLLHNAASFAVPALLVTAVLITALLAAIRVKQKDRLFLAAAGASIVAVSVLSRQIYFVMLLPVLPAVVAKNDAVLQTARADLLSLPFIILASALISVTFAINMNYYLPGTGIWYLVSLCIQMSFMAVLLILALSFLSVRVAAFSVPAGRFFWLAGMSLVLFFILKENIRGFSSKLGLTNVEYVIPAALTTLIFVLCGDSYHWVAVKNKVSGRRILILRLVVLGLLLNLGFRNIYGAEKDLVLDVYQDVLFVLTAGLLVLAMLNVWHVLISPLRGNKIWAVGSFAGLLIAWAAFPLFSQKTWTYQIEANREYSRFVSSSVRSALAYAGIPDKRDVAKKEAQLRELIKQAPVLPGMNWIAPDTPVLPGDRSPPHVFIFVADATTRLRMGVYGYDRNNTPNLTLFAQEALIFRNFFAASSATFQSVVAMFSGEYGGRRAAVPDNKRVRLCDGLHQKNYRLLMAGIGHDIFDTGKHCAPAKKLSAEGHLADDYEQIRNSLLSDPGTPHFVYQHVNGGHNPWQVAPEDEVYGKGKPDIYDALLRVADRQFGELVSFLKAQGIYENSIIIFTSDHGIGLGYHMDKSSYSNLYSHNTDIPFLMKVPGLPAGEITSYHTHVDLLPTLGGLLGFDIKGSIAGLGPGFTSSGAASDRIPDDRCVFAIAEYKNTVAMMCHQAGKLIWNVEEKILHVYKNTDVLEEHDLIDDYSLSALETLAAPLLQFVATGQGTYIQ